MNTKPMNIDNLIAEVKASGHSAKALIGGSTYYVWINKDGKTSIACGRNRISLKNARAAIAKATGSTVD